MQPYAEGTGYVIYHGDSLDVLNQMAPDSISAIVTDPPYCSGGRQNAGARKNIAKSPSRRDGGWFLGDNMGSDAYLWWMREIAREALRVVTPGSMGVVFTDWRQYSTTVVGWETVGWTLQNVLVWDKNRGGAMGSYWRNNHEWAPIFTKGKPRGLAHRSAFNTWTGSKPQGGPILPKNPRT